MATTNIWYGGNRWLARTYSHVDCQREFDVKDWIDNNPTRRSPTHCSHSALLLWAHQVCSLHMQCLNLLQQQASLSVHAPCAPRWLWPVIVSALTPSQSNQSMPLAIKNQSMPRLIHVKEWSFAQCVVFVRTSSLSLSLCFHLSMRLLLFDFPLRIQMVCRR